MISRPTLAVMYCCPTEYFGAQHFNYAQRFAKTMEQFDPGFDFTFVVVSNGGAPSEAVCQTFGQFAPHFLVHDDSGMDIGAYQIAAQSASCDLMLFFGGSTYIRGNNWARRVMESYEKHGNALYGVMGHTGDDRFNVFPHIRTTGFWCPPSLMNTYPLRIRMSEQRYPFEHGHNCLTQWVRRQGLKALVVTWDHEYEQDMWGAIPGGYHNGTQFGMLFGDRLSEPPFHPTP